MHSNGRDEVVVSLTHYETKNMSSLMCWRMYVLGYVVRFKQSAKLFGLERVVKINFKIANDDSRNNGDGCFDE